MQPSEHLACRQAIGGELQGGAAERILICGSLYLAGQVLALQHGVQAQIT